MAQEKILIVDDEQLFRELLTDFLSTEGYRVDTAASGQEALEKMAQEKYDLMVLDLMMPGMDGLEALEKAKGIDPEISVIIATAYGSIESAVAAMSKGAYYYINKPINKEEFRHILRNCLEKRRLELENLALKREVTFLEIGKALASTLELKKLLALILDSAFNSCRADGGYIMVKPSSVAPETYPRMSRGIKGWEAYAETPWDSELIEIFEKFSGYQLLTDLGKKKEFDSIRKKYNASSAIAVTLAFQQEILGQLVLLRYGQNQPFTHVDLRIVSLLATQGSVVLKNALLYKDIQDLTIKDDETKAFNRRYLDEYLDEELKRAHRYNHSLALIFLDLDHLKKINDKYGHLMGSAVLRETADLLLTLIRKVDKLIRYGGDEFIVILPETELPGALKVAERIRLHIKEHVFTPRAGIRLRMTASLGVAMYPQHGLDKESLIGSADQAMYKIKESTRDGVAVALG